MNNYTYEQRKMIAEYLKNEILTLEKSWGNVQKITIKEIIEKLKTVTFGDIKNQVGTRFYHPDEKDRVYRIISGYQGEYKIFLLDEKTSCCLSPDRVRNDVQVEVIDVIKQV